MRMENSGGTEGKEVVLWAPHAAAEPGGNYCRQGLKGLQALSDSWRGNPEMH